MTLEQLRARLKELRTEAKALVDGARAETRELTAEEATAFDAAMDAAEAVEANIARLERIDAATARDLEIRPAAGAGQGVIRSGGDPANTQFETLGQFVAAVAFNPSDQRLTGLYNPDVGSGGDGASAEQRFDTGSTGGFMIPTEFREQIMQVAPQDALVRPRAMVIPAGDNPDAAVEMPYLQQGQLAGDGNTINSGVYGGVLVGWTEEGELPDTSEAKLGMVRLQPWELTGLCEATQKLLRNWKASDPFLRTLLRGAMVAAEDVAFQTGNGVKKPLGVLKSPALKKVNRATANTVTYADVVNMLSVWLMRGNTSGVWSAPQSLLPKLATMKDEEGHLIWQPNARDGIAGTLLGIPLRWNNRAPAVGTLGDLQLNDWSAYIIKDGAGPFISASEHAKFAESKVLIKLVYNVDGASWQKEPFKEENGHEVSPFVALDVPAG